MTVDPLGTFRDDLVEAARRDRPGRRRRAAALVGAVATLALVAAIVGTGATDPDRRDEEVVTGAPPATARPAVDGGPIPNGAVWSIAEPAGWRRAGRELLPDLSPTSLTLATIPLSDGAGGPCASVPSVALQRLGAEDALLSVVFYGVKAATAPPWPDGDIDDRAFQAGPGPHRDARECGLPDDIEVLQQTWSRGGQGIAVLVAFGSGVTADRRAETFATLSSLAPETGDSRAAPVCIVTRPTEPGLTVPDSWPASPPTGVWYGTHDLWTALPTDGSSPSPRKSVWWSARFLGGSRDPDPDINVTWERLDEPAPIIQALSEGTNAYSPDSGSFMIAGADPPTAGCWSVTGSYGTTNLRYVYWTGPGIWVDDPPFEQGDDAGLEGTVRYDEDRNCVVLGGDDGTLHPVVWPGGTTISAQGRINLADGTTLEPGDRVRAAGSSQRAEPHLVHAPQGCMPEGGAGAEVFVMWQVTQDL